MARRKKTTTKDCLAVRRLFEATGIKAERLIAYLEKTLESEAVSVAVWQRQALKYPELKEEAMDKEMNHVTGQLLVSVLKIALMEGKDFKYVDPSLN